MAELVAVCPYPNSRTNMYFPSRGARKCEGECVRGTTVFWGNASSQMYRRVVPEQLHHPSDQGYGAQSSGFGEVVSEVQVGDLLHPCATNICLLPTFFAEVNLIGGG